ncbi:MAG: hypothetical protein WCN98_13325 [Verrucomicrobiaceae bacterium]
MSDEASEKRSSGTGWVTGIAVALILYILAPGPVTLLMANGVVKSSSTAFKVFDFCFWPLEKLNENVKPVKSFYIAYFEALGLDASWRLV